MLSIVLKNNVIEFNGDYFLQTQGKAMGTKMAPAYANLFMGSLEPILLSHGQPHINMWKRFIFLIWTGSPDQLKSFTSKINTIHPTIKFTYEHSMFLDVVVYKGPQFTTTGLLDVKTHIKPTNKTSYHPDSVKAAIQKGETQRYLRSNTREETFTHTTKQLKNS